MNQSRKTLSRIKIQKPLVIYRQITERVRAMILSGELAPGAKLPSTSELATSWGAQVASVHAAMTPLVKEGLLLRYPKKGTFVRERVKAIHQIAIYNPMDITAAPGQDFKRSVQAAMAQLLEAENIMLRVWTDTRPLSEQHLPLERLVRAADNREMQAVVAAGVDGKLLRWLTKLPVVTAFFTTQAIPGRITLDYEQAAELYVQSLADKGARSIGIICNLQQPAHTSEFNTSLTANTFYQTFFSAAKRRGLEIQEDWIRSPEYELGGTEFERWGYEQFHAIWKLPKRPEGIAVFPGTSVRGIILAAMECQVKIPEQLHFAFHRNVESSILCPFPASWLVSSGAEVASSLIDQVKRQFDGRAATSILLPLTLQLEGTESSPAHSSIQPKQMPEPMKG